MFTFKKDKINLEEIQEKDPEGYEALMSAAKEGVEVEQNAELAASKAEVVRLKKENARKSNDDSIKEYGEKLKVSEFAAKQIEIGASFSDALLAMVDENLKTIKDIQDSFETTGGKPAGESVEDGNEEEPQSWKEAINMVKERDKITGMEAAKKAMNEWPVLYDNRAEPPKED